MTLFLTSFLIILFIILIMSIGVIFGRKPISGSCGGIGVALKDPNGQCSDKEKRTCSICGKSQ